MCARVYVFVGRYACVTQRESKRGHAESQSDQSPRGQGSSEIRSLVKVCEDRGRRRIGVQFIGGG